MADNRAEWVRYLTELVQSLHSVCTPLRWTSISSAAVALQLNEVDLSLDLLMAALLLVPDLEIFPTPTAVTLRHLDVPGALWTTGMPAPPIGPRLRTIARTWTTGWCTRLPS